MLLTDTTLRDAHQSLLATRMRTYDMLPIAPIYARELAAALLARMWGGATFDDAMRFLKETRGSAWRNCANGSPTSSSRCCCGRRTPSATRTTRTTSCATSWRRPSAGIDLFRIFDALNWVPNMRVAIDAVRKAGALCEGAICYTGDILDPNAPSTT